MERIEIEKLVFSGLEDFCCQHKIFVSISKDTAFIGENKIMDSISLVNFIVDIETLFFDKGVEISLTSEAAMSSKISPFRSVGALCNFIERQLGGDDGE